MTKNKTRIGSPYAEQDISDNLVAFIDILGFKELVSINPSGAIKTINLIDRCIGSIIDILNENYEADFSIKLFSDCFCVSCKYCSENLFYMLYELAWIQMFLSQEGIFLRGALSRGLHFENDRMIFSQGLISAYNLERVALYPRIILSKDLVNEIRNDNSNYYLCISPFKKKQFIMKSPDAHYFIDYLNSLHVEGGEPHEVLPVHKRVIISHMKRNVGDPSILEKYKWVAEYHNVKCKDFYLEDESEKEYLIDISSEFPQFMDE